MTERYEAIAGTARPMSMLSISFCRMKNKDGKPKMLEREAWRFINNRRKDDAEYLKSLDSVSNHEGRELLWKSYLREADQWEEECRRVINSERQRLYNKR
jgi:hypothetical protein